MMRYSLLILIILILYNTNCNALEIKALDMFDMDRSRNVPVLIYQGGKVNKSVVIISHGYEVKNSEYSFIANKLASLGYFVVSIQHDLKTDDPLPKTGNLYEMRLPFWERGVQNISFVVDELQKMKPDLNFKKVILIGHSNGGNISMMFATRNPESVSKIISLDSRRFPFTRNPDIEILRFGAIDDEPDKDVVPASGVQVVYVKDARHLDLCDRGSKSIIEEIQRSIVQFLER